MNMNEASFSMLAMSIASSAAMALGLAPHPETQKIEKDKNMAKFNIDLLIMLQEKTKGNLSEEEARLLTSVVADLQNNFINFKN